MLGGIIFERNSERLQPYMRGPVVDQAVKQVIEMAFGKELTEITGKDVDKKTKTILIAMKGCLEIISSSEIDTEVKSIVIEQSPEAKGTEKLMYGVNSINQQVRSLHYQADPQMAQVIKLLPDYPCIEFSIRKNDIAKWQRSVKKLLAQFSKKKWTPDEIKKVQEAKAKAFEKIKRPRLKEFSAQLNGTANSYSLIFKDAKNQTRVWLQNKDENKKKRQRPEDNAKTHESLLTLPKKSGFADQNG